MKPVGLLLFLSFAAYTHAQGFNPENTVLALSKLRPKLWYGGPGVEIKYGTGFCLDSDCRFVGTNYHVAMLTSLPLKIKGEQVVQRYLATGPDDEGAMVTDGADGSGINPMKYNRSRDLAVFELRRPLSRKGFYGLALSRDGLQNGQGVDIYAYPKGAINPRRTLTRFPGRFLRETKDDLLAFSYESPIKVKPGASGGIVVSSGKIVGVLSGVAKNGDTVAFAVPVRSLADFLSKAQPYLHAQLFPGDVKVSPVAADLYPEWIPPAPSGALQHRPEEPAEIRWLRRKAQDLADSIRNFIAVQTFAWGTDNKNPVTFAEYEIQVIDGRQRFRDYPDGKKIHENVPFPPVNTVMVPGGEWSELPKRVGTDLNLKVDQAEDTVVNGKRVLVFQYHADVEDKVCQWRTSVDFGFYVHNKDSWVACYGEVWTDENFNILRISENARLLNGGWQDYRAVVTYDWLTMSGKESKLIPATIASQVDYKQKVYWCRGLFTKYQVFGTKVRILPPGSN